MRKLCYVALLLIGSFTFVGCGGGVASKSAPSSSATAQPSASSSSDTQQGSLTVPVGSKGLNCPSAKRVADVVGYKDLLYGNANNGHEIVRGTGIYACVYFDRPQGGPNDTPGYSYRVGFNFVTGVLSKDDLSGTGAYKWVDVTSVVVDRPDLGTGAFENTSTNLGGGGHFSAELYYPGDGGYYVVGVDADPSMGLSLDQLKGQNKSAYLKLFRGMTVRK
jgi:hypothetical protein